MPLPPPPFLPSDATLSNLVVDNGDTKLYSDSNCEYPIDFNPETTSYYASVDNSVESIMVTPTLSDPNASVSVNDAIISSGQASDPINLNEGSNIINVIVTTQDGSTTETYTIIIIRMPAE